MRQCKNCEYYTEKENGSSFDGEGWVQDYSKYCTRFPKWVKVKEDHYCGEFKEEENEI